MKYLLFIIFSACIYPFSSYASSITNVSPEITKTIQQTDDTTLPKQKIENNTDNTDEFEDEFEDEFADNSILFDPLNGYNRLMTSFNDNAYTYLLKPSSKVYAAVVPEFLRIGIANAYHNIKFPIHFANNLLQLKFQNSVTELKRFVVNSTVGLLGLMDPAKEYMHLEPHEEDFGQTLGYYGVGSGFHVVLPLLGPSNARDILGLSVDTYISPLTNIGASLRYKIPNSDKKSIFIWANDQINKNSLHSREYESAKKDALDLYTFLRDAYEQKRRAEIAK